LDAFRLIGQPPEQIAAILKSVSPFMVGGR
jgi:hypothetical protein